MDRATDIPSSSPPVGRFVHDADHALVARRREDHICLGFALQLGTVRFLGTFLTDPTDVPPSVVSYMSHQLQIEDPSCLPRYLARRVTHHEHAQDITRRYGYRDFHAPREVFRLVRWLYTRAWLSAERPSVLFDLATARLVEHKVLLPGSDRAGTPRGQHPGPRCHTALAAAGAAAERRPTGQAGNARAGADGARLSPLDRLRRAPTRVSGPALVAALQRLEEIRATGVSHARLSRICPRIASVILARYAAAARAQAIARMAPERRLATLLAFAMPPKSLRWTTSWTCSTSLITDDLIHDVETDGQQRRLRTAHGPGRRGPATLGGLQVLLDEQIADRPPSAARPSSQHPAPASGRGRRPGRRPGRPTRRPLLTRNSSTAISQVRRFLPTLLRTVAFDGTQAGQADARRRGLSRDHRTPTPPGHDQAPLALVPGPGSRLVRQRQAVAGSTRLYPLYAGTLARQSATPRRVCPTQSIAGATHASSCCKGPPWETPTAPGLSGPGPERSA